MSIADKLLETLNEESVRVQTKDTFYVDGNEFQPGQKKSPPVTVDSLPAGVYDVKRSYTGVYLERQDIHSDELIKFEDPRMNLVTNEISAFWEKEDNFKKHGFIMKRGILLHGAPGCGKSCLIKQVQEQMIEQNNLIFVARDPGALTKILKDVREVETERRIVVILEDIDEMVRWDEGSLLELMDGPDSQHKVLYLGTTNYLEKLPPRMQRSGRFDRKVEVLPPGKEGRLAYFQAKLGIEEEEAELQEMVDKTDGLNFGDLREFVIAVYCLEEDPDIAISRIKGGASGIKESYVTADNLLGLMEDDEEQE